MELRRGMVSSGAFIWSMFGMKRNRLFTLVVTLVASLAASSSFCQLLLSLVYAFACRVMVLCRGTFYRNWVSLHVRTVGVFCVLYYFVARAAYQLASFFIAVSAVAAMINTIACCSLSFTFLIANAAHIQSSTQPSWPKLAQGV